MAIASYSKLLQVSADNSTWVNLPADSPTLSINNSPQETTTLGNNDGFKSRTYGLKDFSISAEGNFVPINVYSFTLKKSGTSTAMTDEAMSNTTGNSYKIDAAAKEIFDRDADFVFKDGGSVIAVGSIASIDYLSGTVTLTGAASGAVTVTGNYIPVTASIDATTASLEMNAELEETTSVNSGANNYKTRTPKLKDVSISISSYYDVNRAVFGNLNAAETVLAEITLGGSALQTIRGWFMVESNNASGGVADVESEEISLQLNGNAKSAFSWSYPASGFDVGLSLLTGNYFNGGALYARYYPEGVGNAGQKGPVLVESFSLALDVNNKTTFSVTLQCNGELTSA